MELKNYSIFLISAFAINTLFACSETEIIAPKEACLQTADTAVESSVFEAKVSVSGKGKVSLWLQNQQEKAASYTFRLRVVDSSSGEFRLIGAGVTDHLKPRQSQKFDFNTDRAVSNNAFRVEVYHAGDYLGDYPIQ